MKGIFVGTKPSYKVIIGKGALTQVGSLIKKSSPEVEKVLIVTDSNVAPLYLDTVKKGLEISKFEVSEFIYEAGEQNKNIGTVSAMWEKMAEEGFTRTDAVVSLGGGVTTDMGGFAAATFLRGIKVFQVPTSLLAMVDAAVGGKTGIDLRTGKNLAGAFHQPSMVIEDTDCLITKFFLDFLEDAEAEKNSQLAEAIAQLNSYDLILFLEPDVEWVQDGDRSEVIAADREKYSAKIKELYKKHGFTFKVISGDYNSRFDRAVKLIKDILQS